MPYTDNTDKLSEGFAIVARPAVRGETGIMTFMITQNNILYEADLGNTSGQIASTITGLKPSPMWQPADTAFLMRTGDWWILLIPATS